MKNLRKVLSLILVVAMACSFMMFASAKDYEEFTDAADISDKYLEAVDVAAALEIFIGDETGKLDPQGTFTRAQAAKIVSYMSIGKQASEALTATGGIFADVPADFWASKYIAYAANAGILNGDGDGNFRPEDAVTGAEVAKLMNTVLGYGKKGEYVGPSWQINSISDGISRGLIVNVDDLTAPALREEVIQAVFNTIRPDGELRGIKNKMVEYSNIINGYVYADGSGGTGAAVNAAKSTLGRFIFNLTFNGFDDNSGYPVHDWKVGAVIISDVYPDAPADYRSTNGAVIYTTSPIWATSDLESRFNLSFHATRTAAIFYNGVLVIDGITNTTVGAINSNRLLTAAQILAQEAIIANPLSTADEIADAEDVLAYNAMLLTVSAADKIGVIVDIYLDYEGFVERIVIIEKQASKITSATIKNSYGGVSNIGGITEHAGAFVTYAGDINLVKDDYTLWYVDRANVVNIEKLAPVEGQLTRYTTATYTVAFGGADYSLSDLTGHPAVAGANRALVGGTDAALRDAANYKKDASIYVDDNGSIIYFIPPAGAAPQYMYVLAVSTNGFGTMDKVRAIFPDGTIKVVNAVDALANYPADRVLDRVIVPADDAQWVSYSYDEATDVYTLLTLTQAKAAFPNHNALTAIGSATPKTLSGRTAFLDVAGGPFNGATRMIGDSSTVFIFYNAAAGGSAKAYVGINSLPNLDLDTADLVCYYNSGFDIYDDYVLIETNALAYDDIYTVFALQNQSMTDYFGVPNINAYENVIINGEVVAKPWFDTLSAVGVPETLMGLYQAKVREVSGEKVHLITASGQRVMGGSYQDLGNHAINIFYADDTTPAHGMPYNVAASLPMYLVSPANFNVPQKFEYATMSYFVPATKVVGGVTVPVHYNIFYTTDLTNVDKITALYFVPASDNFSAAIDLLVANYALLTGTDTAADIATALAGLTTPIVYPTTYTATAATTPLKNTELNTALKAQEANILAYINDALATATITGVTATATYVTRTTDFTNTAAGTVDYVITLKDGTTLNTYSYTFTVTAVTIAGM